MFKPGVSGNPGGRPPLTTEQRKARDLARKLSVEAIQTLAGVMRDSAQSAKDRVAAAKVILSHGLPAQIEFSQEFSQDSSPAVAKLEAALQVAKSKAARDEAKAA